MPAKNLHRVDEKGVYSHIYNKGVENRDIFKDQEDYETFLGFLNDYLSAPKDPESVKKTFEVHGRTFRGTPHQPKNYLNKVELLTYSLNPNHFHLVLHQVSKGSLEKFIRSLCTRYSMYFNKKYNRTGSLFDGPYKSSIVEQTPHLALLSWYLHQGSEYSSYPEYIATRDTSWVIPNTILSLYENGAIDYKDYVEKHELEQEEQELLNVMALEALDTHLERRTPIDKTENVAKPSFIHHFRIPLFLTTSLLVFALLFLSGVRNISLSSANSTSSSDVLGEKEVTNQPSLTTVNTQLADQSSDLSDHIGILTVKLENATASASIQQGPTADSEKVGEAKNGQSFEYVYLNADWYEIRLENGATGFIFKGFAEVPEEDR